MAEIGSVVLNTRVNNMGSRVCIFDLHEKLQSTGIPATLNDWSGYGRYDVAFFMGVDHEIERARKENPNIFVVICDPKQSSIGYIDAARQADLLVVSSIEQREAFLRLNSNIIVYPMFPLLNAKCREHEVRSRLVIGYHGNKVHLEAMGDTVSPAIEELSKKYEIELRLIYNYETLGKVLKGLPSTKMVVINHVQWHDNVFEEHLPDVDIGIVPNLLPIGRMQETLKFSEVDGLNVNYEPFDFLNRYKASCNPGRVAVFARYGIPVVSDFTPSACLLIREGYDSFLAGTVHGWYHGLSQLAASPTLRETMGARLNENVIEIAEKAYGALLKRISERDSIPTIRINSVRTAEDDLLNFVRPKGVTLLQRISRRVSKILAN